MQIQCQKCKQWTDAEASVCQWCGACREDDPNPPEELEQQISKDLSQEFDIALKKEAIKAPVLKGYVVAIYAVIGIVAVLFIWMSYELIAHPELRRDESDNIIHNQTQQPKIDTSKRLDAEINPNIDPQELLSKHTTMAEQLLERYHASEKAPNTSLYQTEEQSIIDNRLYSIPIPKRAPFDLFENMAKSLYHAHSTQFEPPTIVSTFDSRVFGANKWTTPTYYCLTATPTITTPSNLGSKHRMQYALTVRLLDAEGNHKIFIKMPKDSQQFGFDYMHEAKDSFKVPVLYGVGTDTPSLNGFEVIEKQVGSSWTYQLIINDAKFIKQFEPGESDRTIRFVFPVSCQTCDSYYYLVYREFKLSNDYKICYNNLQPSNDE